MYIIKKRFSDSLFLTGMIMLAISLLFFVLPLFRDTSDDGSGWFIFNFGITVVYFFCRWIQKEKATRESKLHHRFLFLILFFISCWALNREMNVFEHSANWFAALLVVLCANYIAAAFLTGAPQWVVHTVSFINGVSLLTFIYLSIYLLPLYAISLGIFFLLGISLHTFIPLLLSIYTIVLQARMSRRNNSYWLSFATGILIPVSIISIYAFQWNYLSQKINTSWAKAEKNSSSLPAWVAAAQDIPPTSFSKDIIKSTFVYSMSSDDGRSSFWRVPSRVIGERRQHNPLVMIASFFNKDISMDDDSRIKILGNVFGMRHETSDRLWTGDHLYTDSVKTEVKIWPRCNMAYTEKTITVGNDNMTSGWPRQEEAIYTFYMPEGSVVTSLSLWINGKEEKSILTTKDKANVAYESIVGKERRDPSVVHWQEGNTVSVRVFPVEIQGKRMFKIGITSPMAREKGKLLYENITFKGPASTDASEDILVDFEQPVRDYKLPASFTSNGQQSYHTSGAYDPDWSIAINDPGLAGCSYSFDNNEYSLSPYHKKLVPTVFSSLYLDINCAWTEAEFNNIMRSGAGKNLFVYSNGIVKLTADNRNEIWEKAQQQLFTVFPLYMIEDPEHSLLITKNTSYSPEFNDLEGSVFVKTTQDFLSGHDAINVFNLGDKLSLYLSSLKEMRVFRYDNGDLDLLLHRLDKGLFPENIENDNLVVIHKTDMIIEKKPGMTENSGPDHVVRLFAYNHIMQKLGKDFLFNRSIDDKLVKEAQSAYVITPVSSMIVLESQDDYERFDIKGGAYSLGNASLHSKGAVPEPHEWVLIGLVVVVLGYIIRKRKIQYSTH